MSKKILKMLGVQIAVSYTIVSICIIFFEWLVSGSLTHTQNNILMQFGFTIVFVGILNCYKFFPTVSPLFLGIIQIIIAESTVMLFLFVGSFFTELHPDGYRDMFISTMIPFSIGALVYYLLVYLETKRNNKLIKKLTLKNRQK